MVLPVGSSLVASAIYITVTRLYITQDYTLHKIIHYTRLYIIVTRRRELSKWTVLGEEPCDRADGIWGGKQRAAIPREPSHAPAGGHLEAYPQEGGSEKHVPWLLRNPHEISGDRGEAAEHGQSGAAG